MTAPAKQNRAYLVADEQAFRTSPGGLIAAGFETATFAAAEFFAEPSSGTGCVIMPHRRAGFDLAEKPRGDLVWRFRPSSLPICARRRR